MTKYFKTMIIFLLLAFVVSCAGEGIIPRAKLINIMIDMHIADGLKSRSVNMPSEFSVQRDSVALYGPIFAKYGYDIDDFNKSVDYYAGNPHEMKEMYDVILKRLRVMRDEYAEFSIQERKDKNLWNGPDSLFINSDSVFSKFDFDIPIKGIGTYVLSADIHFGENDSTYNPYVIAWFEIEKYIDSIIGKQENVLDKKQTSCTLRLYMRDTSEAHMKGHFFDYDSINSEGRQHVQFKNIYVEYIESKDDESSKPDFLPAIPLPKNSNDTLIRKELALRIKKDLK